MPEEPLPQTGPYQHWRIERDDAGSAWLYLDQAGAGTNVLSSEVLRELGAVVDELRAHPPAALIVLSNKASGFIAGADVREIASIADAEAALALVQLGHATFDRLEALPFPTVAAIKGFCLGGGMELALALRHRVAVDEPGTRLGLPEVLLGIHPGFGGTMRSIRLIGAPAAMDLMLSGRTVDARAAVRLGLVDRAVPLRHFRAAARACATRPPARHRPGLGARVAAMGPVRPLLGAYLRREVQKRAPAAHYPAPYALIDLFERYGGDPRRMLAEEAQSIARLATGTTARNLVRVFFLQERLKSLGRGETGAKPHVHVIGAGVMGGDIAAWCALRGLKVTLQDRAPKYIAPALRRASELYAKRIRDRRLRQAALDRLVPDPEGLGVPKADVVIEAIIENIEAKHDLYRALEPRLKPEALLATNTSSIPLETLAECLKRPERLVGLHFFNPVAKMQLIEIISTPATDRGVQSQAAGFARGIDRLPLPVRSAPGFLVNRILLPYLMEAITMLSEGLPAARIDQAATNFGMPMGPIELADTVGLDVCLSVGGILGRHFGSPVPARLEELVKQGHLGRKSGQGFYKYRKGKVERPGVPKGHGPDEDITDRLILRMLNESVACLREGVVEDADLVDAGMIFGSGFAPFRGGPMQYLKARGRDQVAERLSGLAARFGSAYRPDAGFADLPVA